MTRRSLFARLSGALAAVPLVGKVVRERWTSAEIQEATGSIVPPKMTFRLAEIEDRDFRCPLRLKRMVTTIEQGQITIQGIDMDGKQVYLSGDSEGRKYFRVPQTSKAVDEFNAAAARNAKRVQDALDRFFHEG